MILLAVLERADVAKALRAGRTFATTGERLVGLVSTEDGELQGDEVSVAHEKTVKLEYAFYGASGFSSVEAWDASGDIFHRDLQQEASKSAASKTGSKLQVKWGGARLYNQYREAAWNGSILIDGAKATRINPFGGVSDDPESVVKLVSRAQVTFQTKTSGDFDGVDIYFEGYTISRSVSVSGQLVGYVKVGDALRRNPHKAQPEYHLQVSSQEAAQVGGKQINIKGGADLFMSAEKLLDVELPKRVEGVFNVEAPGTDGTRKSRAIYFVGREWSGGKVITSPVFLEYSRGNGEV